MSDESTIQLQKKFKEVFPEHYELLSLAKSQDEIDELHTRFISEAKVNLDTALKNENASGSTVKIMSTTPADETSVITLKPNEYEKLINARKGEILREVHSLIDTLTRLQKLHDNEIGPAIAIMAMNGMFAISLVARFAAKKAIKMGATEIGAMAAGLEAITIATIIAALTFVMILVLIPILFFMSKPANCLIAIVNELDDEIVFQEDHAVHGKAKLMTTPLPEAITIYFKGDVPVDENGNSYNPDIPPGEGPIIKKVYTAAGLIACAKSKQALVGSQYGFTFMYGDTKLSFGVENPVTSMYVDNNCFCAIGESAEYAAKQTNKHNKQEWHTTKDGITLEIRCNSGHGSTAYYVARAYKKEE